jgi:hypothetical protein
MNGVFQFSFQKIGRSSKGNNKVEGEGAEGGGMEEEGATMHCKKPKAHATIAQ